MNGSVFVPLNVANEREREFWNNDNGCLKKFEGSDTLNRNGSRGMVTEGLKSTCSPHRLRNSIC